MQLRGSAVVVTGASAGIGRAAAVALAARGAAVVAVGRDADALADVTRLTGGTSVRCDVADLDHPALVIEHTLAAHGRLDAIVANAGIGWAGEFAEMPSAEIAALLDVNLRAPMLLAQAAIPLLVAQGSGSLVFVTSIAGVLPVPGEAAYSLSKTALESFADAIRAELRGTGVSVSTVRPGVVRTEFFDRRGQPYTRRWPRLIAPERIAAAVVEVIETGKPQRTEPRWLGLPALLRRLAPGSYRAMSRPAG